jgi:hypothetical protein
LLMGQLHLSMGQLHLSNCGDRFSHTVFINSQKTPSIPTISSSRLLARIIL